VGSSDVPVSDATGHRRSAQEANMNGTTSSAPRLIRTGAIGVAAATIANIAIFGVGRLAGVDYVIAVHSQGAEHVRLSDVALMSVVPLLIGLAAALVAVRLRRPGLLTALLVLGGVLAVVSTAGDAGIESDLAAKLLLASMHLVVGAAYIAAVRAARPGHEAARVRAGAAPAVAAA
jgi:hypothetical protein